MNTPTIVAITFDSSDALALAAFWSEALHRPLADGGSSDFAQIDGAPALMFYAVPEGKTAKNRVHLDIDVSDLASETDRLIGLGAKRLADFDEHGFVWTTLADPDGNEFDLVAGSEPDPGGATSGS